MSVTFGYYIQLIGLAISYDKTASSLYYNRPLTQVSFALIRMYYTLCISKYLNK